ncbi:putative ribonuclease H-like domain-containing protein [Tanacetum coccineum]
MIGSLMYLTASRPDIMFAVSACSRHQVTPLTSHLNAVKKIFKYLKGRPKLGLWYPKDSPFQLEAYSDSDYAGSHGDRKSTTGGCQISWADGYFNSARSILLSLLQRSQSTKCIVEEPHLSSELPSILSIRTSLYKRCPMKKTDTVAEDFTTDDNVSYYYQGNLMDQDLRSQYCCWLYILPADSLVSAGSSMFLLVVILPAASLVSAGSSIYPFSRMIVSFLLVRTMDSAVVISFCWMPLFLADSKDYAADSVNMLVDITFAGGSISADRVVCSSLDCRVSAVVILILLAEYIPACFGVVYTGHYIYMLLGRLWNNVYATMKSVAGQISILLFDFNHQWRTQYKVDHNRIAYPGEGKRFRGLHRIPPLLGPLSNKRVRNKPLTPPTCLPIATAGDAAMSKIAALLHEAAESIIFVPYHLGPANYIEPEDLTNLNSMEDENHSFVSSMRRHMLGLMMLLHQQPMSLLVGSKDPALLTSLSAKIDMLYGTIDTLETEFGNLNRNQGGEQFLTLVSERMWIFKDEVDLIGLSRMESEALGLDQSIFLLLVLTEVLPSSGKSLESAGPPVETIGKAFPCLIWRSPDGVSWQMMHRPGNAVAEEQASARFGLPGEIILDNGKQFQNNPFKDWCKKLCIRQHFASVKLPQTNGLVERANRSLREGIKTKLDERSKN